MFLIMCQSANPPHIFYHMLSSGRLLNHLKASSNLIPATPKELNTINLLLKVKKGDSVITGVIHNFEAKVAFEPSYP